MGHEPLAILTVLALCVALSEWLVRRTFLRHFGTALLVIVVTAVVANLGLIPTGSSPVPLYDGIFGAVAPMAIFLLLLGVGLADLVRAGVPMLVLFLTGAAGTVAGVLLGLWVVDGPVVLGEQYRALGGMFAATYIGGSLNFNLLAMEYGVAQDGALYTGSVAVDSIMTSVWMVATLALPRLLAPLWPRGRRRAAAPGNAAPHDLAPRPAPAGDVTGVADDTESAHPLDLALLLALAAGAQWCSAALAAALRERGIDIPSALFLTTIALLLAQVRAVRRLAGARLLGMLGVYLFLAVIGAYCDLAALERMGQLGPTLFVFTAVAIGVHGVITFGTAAALRLDRDVAAVASQANIGGGTSALALARSLGRSDLVLPAILVGSLGTALGTYCGYVVIESLL